MGKIIPKLSLGKTPQNCEDNSLVFAKNIKLSSEMIIEPDSALEQIIIPNVFNSSFRIKGNLDINVLPNKYYSNNILGEIVGINNKIYFFVKVIYKEAYRIPSLPGAQPYYEFVQYGTSYENYEIVEYNELTKEFKLIDCNWNYSGGKIHGHVTSNNTNESILTICEYNDDGTLNVPIKHINLDNCSINDDESLYTQTPNVPLTNLHFMKYYNTTIPCGVYQFFVRYKIRDNFYTEWFPASKELFAGTKKNITTIQGSLNYIDKHIDATKSFVFTVEHINTQYEQYYLGFQIGFILSHDDGTFARSWKTFDFGTDYIFFDYDKTFIKEENLDNILKFNFEITNVKNLDYYKNKLYIANYKENNINEDFQSYANDINTGYVGKQFNLNNVTEEYFYGFKLSKQSTTYPNIYTHLDDNKASIVYGMDGYNDMTIWDWYNDDVNHQYYNVVNTSSIYVYKNIYDGKWYKKVGQSYVLLDNFEENRKKVSLLRISTEYNSTEYVLGTDNYNAYKDNPENPSGMNVGENVSPFGGHEDDNTNVKAVQLNCMPHVRNIIEGLRYDSTYDKFYYQVEANGSLIDLGETRLWVSKIVGIQSIGGIANVLYKPYVIIKKVYKLRVPCYLEGGKQVGGNLDINTNSLMPYTYYRFFIHYVKDNGIVTNGYEITPRVNGNIRHTVDANLFNGTDVVRAFYTTFDNIKAPVGYTSAFISLHVGKNLVCKGFNYTHINGENFVECLELDALLYNTNDDIIIMKGNNLVTKHARYYDSGDSSNISDFGNGGYVKWTGSDLGDTEKIWIIINDINNEVDDVSLIKLTPYFKVNNSTAVSYTKYDDQNIPSWLCYVTKLDMAKNKELYVSGNDIYTKNIGKDSQDITADPQSIGLKEITTNQPLYKSSYYYVWSNFNLSYLSLSQDLNIKVRAYEVSTPSQTDPDRVTRKKQMIHSVDSLTCSYIYELQQMYKEYQRKLYYNYNPKRKTLTKFDNTVRSSDVNADEMYRNIYKFNATDYYNVPTNKGIIVKLFSNLQNIFVHCEHSLFKFVDNKQLQSQEENVVLQENDVFNTGIQEIFDSQYGYGGIQKKHHSIVTYTAYIFYDFIAKTLYAYTGEGATQVISSSIDKLIKWFKPQDVLLAEDRENDRIFINFVKDNHLVAYQEQQDDQSYELRYFEEHKNICLSFNLAAKSFVSVHDFDFDNAFSSRMNCYFSKSFSNVQKIYAVDNMRINNYGLLKAISALICVDIDELHQTDNGVANCIDVICVQNYENIKVLNYINWISENITQYEINTLAADIKKNIDNEIDYTYTAEKERQSVRKAEELNKDVAFSKFRIYTDQCLTDFIDFDNPAVQNNYEKPINNYGIWSFNYFRNVILNNGSEIIHRYTNELRDLEPRVRFYKDVRNQYTTDKTLVFGKYFVARFVFDGVNFKIENVYFNIESYDKVKTTR